MKRQSIFRAVLGISCIVFVGVGGVLAQPPNRNVRSSGRNRATKQDQNAPMSNARILANLGSTLFNPNIKDPLTTHLYALIKRTEVYSELKITSRQREALEKLQQTLSEQLYAKMHDAVEADILDPAGLKELPPNEREKQVREHQEQAKERSKGAMVEFQGDMEEELTKILTAKQMTRLKQLDLQWRGILALGDTRVAQSFELDEEQKTELTEIIADFRSRQVEIAEEAVQDALDIPPPRPDGRGGVAAPDEQPIDASETPKKKKTPTKPEEVQQKMIQKIMEAQPELEKMIKIQEKKLLQILSPDQKQLWKEMQGVKFTFRQSA